MDGLATYTMQDIYGRTTQVRVEITALDANGLKTGAEIVRGELEALSNLGIIRATINVPLAGAVGTPAAGSNTDVGGKCKGTSADDGKVVTLRIPDPIAAIVTADATFDLAEVNLAAYLAEFEAGGLCLISDGEKVASWQSGSLDVR